MATSKREEIHRHILRELRARGFFDVQACVRYGKVCHLSFYVPNKTLARIIEERRNLSQPKWFMLREVCEHGDGEICSVGRWEDMHSGAWWHRPPKYTAFTSSQSPPFDLDEYARSEGLGKLTGGPLAGAFDADILSPLWQDACEVDGALDRLVSAELRRVVKEVENFVLFMCLAEGIERKTLNIG